MLFTFCLWAAHLVKSWLWVKLDAATLYKMYKKMVVLGGTMHNMGINTSWHHKHWQMGPFPNPEDVVSLIIWLESAQQVGGSLGDPTPLLLGGSTPPVRSIIEAAVPWAVTQWIFKDKASIIELPHGDHRDRWKVAIVGAHPSLCADVAFAVQAALQGRTEHQFFGLSCPGHHSASHHCSFRCEVSNPQEFLFFNLF